MNMDYDLEIQLCLASAMYKLGGNFQVFYPKGSSLEKGESSLDNLRVLMSYCDAIAIRDSSRAIEEYVEMMEIKAHGVEKKPIINAGDKNRNPIYELADSLDFPKGKGARRISERRVRAAMAVIYRAIFDVQSI